MATNPAFENRLETLREQARATGSVSGNGVDIAGGPIPRKPGYHGECVVRPPVWTWEIPLYFFVGGLAGMSPVIACAALLAHHAETARGAMWLAGIGAILSPILLVMDLGRPKLFLNMLRVFKYQSAMSVGAWILSAFGSCAVPGLIALELHARHFFPGNFDAILGALAVLLIIGAAIFGLGLATYTGVLIGATAIPVWNLHRVLLPIHFGTAGFGSAVAALELLGHRIRPLNALGFAAAAVETILFITLEIRKHGKADRAAHEGRSGWTIRIGEIFTGPLSLILRGLGAVPFAGVSFLLGALLSRFGWLAAGRASGSDPESVFSAQKQTAA